MGAGEGAEAAGFVRFWAGAIRAFDLLPLRVDSVYASDALAVVEARIPEVGCSDHRPVVSDLVLRDTPLRAARPGPP